MKRIVQFALLALVVLSIVWLVVPRNSATDATSVSASPPAEYVAYYFHRTARCATCLKIESTAHDVIFRDFAVALREGKLLFLPTNVEAAGNEHYIKDYELVSQSLVLVRYSDGRVESSRNLDRVWELVGDSASFDRYLHDELATFLGSQS
jgi:hypothetical protein